MGEHVRAFRGLFHELAASLAEIFLSKRKSLMRSVMRIVRDQQAADNVAQETYVRTSKTINNGPIDHIEAFLYQTARNLAINHKRRLDMRGGIERDDLPEADVENAA